MLRARFSGSRIAQFVRKSKIWDKLASGMTGLWVCDLDSCFVARSIRKPVPTFRERALELVPFAKDAPAVAGVGNGV